MITFNFCPHPQFAEDFLVPTKASSRSACYDVYAQEDITIQSKAQLVDLGFKAQFSEDYVCLLLPRSGTGSKNGVALSNTLGVIDSDYPGPWMSSLYLHGHGIESEVLGYVDPNSNADVILTPDSVKLEVMHFKRGERLIQMLFLKKEEVEFKRVSEIVPITERTGGFGHSGK